MKVLRNYIYNVSYQILAIIMPIITYPYVSRTLLPNGVGIYSYTYSIVQYFVLFAGLGIPLYGNRQIAYVRDSDDKLSVNFWEILLLEFNTVIISLFLYLVFIFFYQFDEKYLLIQSLYIIAVFFDISWLFMGIEDFKKIVIRNTLVKLVTVAAIFIFVRSPRDTGVYVLIMALGTFLGNLTFWPYLHGVINRISLKKLHPFRHIKPTIALFIPQIAIQVYAQLNKTMLGAMKHQVDSGFYNYSDSLIKMILTIVTSIGTVMLPHIANAYSNKETTRVIQMVKKSFNIVLCVSLAMSFGIAAIAQKFAVFFYGKQYVAVGQAILLESVVIIPISLASVIGNQYLVPTNKVSIYTTSVVLGAITNIVINFPLIYFKGLYGAIISTVISEFVVTIYQIYKSLNELPYKKMFKDVKKYLFASVVMFIVVRTLNFIFVMNIFSLLFEISIGIFIYIALLFLTKAVIISWISKFIFKRN